VSRRIPLAVCALLCGLCVLGAFSAGYSLGDQKAAQRVYELRRYTTLPGRLPALNARFRDHTLRLFEKHGMQNVMYCVPTDEKLKDNTLIYVLSHASADAATASWTAFRADPEWQKVRNASEADGKIVEKIESISMQPTDYSPAGR